MELNVEQDITRHYADGWMVTLTLVPSTGTAHLTWCPSDLGDPETFMIRLTPNPLTRAQLQSIERAFHTFEGLDAIAGAQWAYLHDQSRWGWESEEVRDIVDDLSSHIKGALLDATV
ncbi:hypothetical protein [Streptomyces sp. NRRL F-5053]|uniref:hypothetical protein n=1 Tax=Streptomyces sp. NRRL F-5053 TaxID=1463854 RepID=UPI0004C71C7B|nr:hypothetical protein [Streptomyces sp. NRRL F-5053]